MNNTRAYGNLVNKFNDFCNHLYESNQASQSDISLYKSNRDLFIDEALGDGSIYSDEYKFDFYEPLEMWLLYLKETK